MGAIDKEFLDLIQFPVPEGKSPAPDVAMYLGMSRKSADEILSSEERSFNSRDLSRLLSTSLCLNESPYALDLDRIHDFVCKNYPEYFEDFIEIEVRNLQTQADWLRETPESERDDIRGPYAKGLLQGHGYDIHNLGQYTRDDFEKSIRASLGKRGFNNSGDLVTQHKMNVVKPEQLSEYVKGAKHIIVQLTNVRSFLLHNEQVATALRSSLEGFSGDIDFFVQRTEEAPTLVGAFDKAEFPYIAEGSSPDAHLHRSAWEVIIFRYEDDSVRVLLSNKPGVFNETHHSPENFYEMLAVQTGRLSILDTRVSEHEPHSVMRWNPKDRAPERTYEGRVWSLT